MSSSKIGSYAGGLLFGIAWWIFIDGAIAAPADVPIDFTKYVPGLISTLAFFLLNTLDWEMLSSSSIAYGPDAASRARVFVICCVVLSFAGLAGGIMVLTKTDWGEDNSKYPGIAILLQNVFLLLATFTMRIGTLKL